MFRPARLAAAVLFVAATAGLATQANAGLSLSDPSVEAMAAARAAEVCVPEKTAAPLRQKITPRKLVTASRPQDRIRLPYIHGVAY